MSAPQAEEKQEPSMMRQALGRGAAAVKRVARRVGRRARGGIRAAQAAVGFGPVRNRLGRNAFSRQVIQQNLRVENAPTVTMSTSYNHMIHGDLAPIGRVHLVTMGPLVGDEESRHFLSEMDADSNMGARRTVESGRRGPFRNSSGASRVMDRSAHVMYRRRGYSIEITVMRGITSYEMDQLIGKLGAHRLSTASSQLFLIDGKKKKLGQLDRISLEKLRQMIHKALDKRRQVGLVITDPKQRGILHKPDGHKRGMKTAMRKQFQDVLN